MVPNFATPTYIHTYILKNEKKKKVRVNLFYVEETFSALINFCIDCELIISRMYNVHTYEACAKVIYNSYITGPVLQNDSVILKRGMIVSSGKKILYLLHLIELHPLHPFYSYLFLKIMIRIQ